MCLECMQSPCHPRCPNAPEPISVFICSGTGREIYEGEEYWDIAGEQFSEEFIDESRSTSEFSTVCMGCDLVIEEGADCWRLLGWEWCSDCIDEAKRIAINYCDY